MRWITLVSLALFLEMKINISFIIERLNLYFYHSCKKICKQDVLGCKYSFSRKWNCRIPWSSKFAQKGEDIPHNISLLTHKGEISCYDCAPKEKERKTYPVCTIRSTPSEPIHCIVWAKSYLFSNLFGKVEEDDESISQEENNNNGDLRIF
jgi:hypothetical protein